MYSHAFGQLNARVESGGVHISFYLTTPAFQDLRGREPDTIIRVHRRCESGFRWGNDYAEYFDSTRVDKARIIFEGNLEAINRRKFEFVDRRVQVGKTYSYWVSTPAARHATGPVAVRVRDPHVWWPHAEVQARLDAVAEHHPEQAEHVRFGSTVGGRPISGLRVGNRDRCVALIGAIHPGESGPELIIPAVERLLQEQNELLEQIGVAILPNVVVDEREKLVQGCAWYLRKNSRGVDINRNFAAEWETVAYGYGLVSSDPDAATYRGPEAESEPETRAVVAFLNTVRPMAVLSYHALASITGATFLAPQAATDNDAYNEQCKRLVTPYVSAFYPDGVTWNAGMRHGTSTGSLPAYAYHKLGIPGFDLEWDGNPDAKISHRDLTAKALLSTYQERHYNGILAMLRAGAAG